MPRCRGFLQSKLMRSDAVLRQFLFASFCASLILFSGCGLSNQPINWKNEFNIFPTRSTSRDKAVFETNAEGGSASSASTSFQLTKGTFGGSYRKSRATSASFVLTGGAIHAP